jgi:replication factor C large subunit
MHTAWTIKHKPQTLAEVVGNKDVIQKLVTWVKAWDKGIPKKRVVFIYGPPGIGKTVAVETLAKDLDMELVEKNASDYRTEEAVKKFAGIASQYATLFGKKRLILFDELDGITGTQDRGGVKALTEIIKVTRCPLVLIANNAYDPKFTTLRNYCLLLQFKKPPVGEVAKLLKKICAREGIEAEEDALKFIAQRSGGDVRSAINDLQALAQGKTRLTYEDVSWLAYRDRQENIFTILRMIFYARSCISAKQAVDMADVDPDMLFEWIYENVPRHLTHPRDLARAMNALSLADVYRGRIRSTRNWKFTRYFMDFMTAGVAMARRETKPSGWTPFRFPKRIQTLSRSKASRRLELEIGRKIRRKCHISSYRASKEVLPYIRIIFENNVDMAVEIARWLDLNAGMIKYIAGEEQAEAIIRLLEA